MKLDQALHKWARVEQLKEETIYGLWWARVRAKANKTASLLVLGFKRWGPF